ncbi:baseplate J/gp47 family protein [Chromobacterium violaceum]|uniref:baseplate J/gp47 family protein n=1 Tax=Chromobacterium violaceum TaxID=536 RepID=UPI001C3D23B7|nr:baseplate J/gp47 family protein [Chromobacterium violaceum]
MNINIKDFATLVRDQVTAITGRAAGLVDFTIGSLMLAVVESNASVLQWVQQLILNLLATTRAATCSGSDLDTWMADYGFQRLSANQATGSVTFSRFTPANSALIPIGQLVASADGSQQFTVSLDATNALYSATLSGYLVPAGTASATVPVIANTAGAAGNALAGTVTVIVGSISGIDTVTNASALANGLDAELDDAYRARFRLWLGSLSKGTKAAIQLALASMQQGVYSTVTENQDYSGNFLPGYFYVVVDDGSGSPSSTFQASAANVVDSVRALTTRFAVFPPQLVQANVSMLLVTDPSGSHAAIVSLVTSALQAYIAGLTLGQLLPYSQLAAIAYGTSPLVLNVTNIQLNSGTADLAATQKQVIRAGTITVG